MPHCSGTRILPLLKFWGLEMASARGPSQRNSGAHEEAAPWSLGRSVGMACDIDNHGALV